MKKYLPVLLTVAAGLIVTAVAFLVFFTQEQSRLRSDFQGMAADRAQAIQSAVSEDSVELALLADYVAASAELSRGELGPFAREFERLVRRLPSRESDTLVVAYVSSLPAAGRALFEGLMRKEVDPGFALHEPGPGGNLLPAAVRPLSYPVTSMEPVEYTGSILGLDLASVPPLRDAIAHAISSGKLTASAAVEIPSSASHDRVIWSFIAAYGSSDSEGRRLPRAALLGVCAMASRVDQLVENSLKPLSPAGIDLELVDTNAPPSEQLLHYHASRVPGYISSSVVKTGMKWSTRINAGERSWLLTAWPTTRFISQHRSWQSRTIVAGGLLLTVLAAFIFWGRQRRTQQVESQVIERTQELAAEIAKHETLERDLAESRGALTAQVVQLNEKNQQILLLNQVGEALQTCLTAEEAYATVSLHAPLLLPGTSGVLFIHAPATDLFFTAARWGERAATEHAFKAEDCWALRRGKSHAVTPSSANLPCPHSEGAQPASTLCIPLAATGRTIGLLHVTPCSESMHAFAESVAEHIGLALSNLMLRSDLRQLSIHDPLTGLYNRRYMEETLETEIRRAERKGHPIGVIMLDIDHFKRFNDGFGHAAGDQMLRSIGALVLENLRAGDIACRYGGEEMLLILPEASIQTAAQRAEEVRVRAKKLEVRHLDTPLGPVTVSLGVAVYPAHGRTRDTLLASADASLYKAKQEGRDRVIVTDGGEGAKAAVG